MSSTGSRTGTPIRAIVSTISGRSGSTIPPASQTFDPLVKALFRHRLQLALLLSAVVSWAVTSSWAWWLVGGSNSLGFFGSVSKPFKLWIIILSALTWVAVAVPVFVLRGTFLTAQRSPAVSPKDILKIAFNQPRTRIAAVTYLASSLVFLFIHTILVRSYESDSKLTLFVKSKKHPQYLNGRLVFLAISQIVAGLVFGLRGVLTDQFVFPWSQAISSRKTSASMIIVIAMLISTVLATFTVSAATLVFAVARLLLPVLYKVPLLPMILRPFTAHFLKGSWTIFLPLKHYRLLVRAWYIAFSTLVNWEISDKLFCNVVGEPADVSYLSQSPNIALVSGVTSTDKVFQFYAYTELLELAADPSAAAATRRADIFGDHKSAVNLWTFLVRESLVLLGKDYQTFLRRGRPLPPQNVVPAAKPVDMHPELATPAPLLQKRVFKAERADPGIAALDALASDGPIARALNAGVDETHVPELFRSVRANVLGTPPAQKTAEAVKEMAPRMKGRAERYCSSLCAKYVPPAVREAAETLAVWWDKKRISKEVELALPFWELDVAVVEVLAYLTSASLEEDRYGVVQRDIPRILEAMVSYLSAIEEYHAEVSALIKTDPAATLSHKEQQAHDALLIEVQKAQVVLGQTAEGIKGGIALISRTFGDKLQAFKFPTRIARKLQMFIDYS